MAKTCANIFYLLAYLLIQSRCCNSGFPTHVSPRFAIFYAWVYVYVYQNAHVYYQVTSNLRKFAHIFPRNCMINPGVNFWVSIQCGENTTLFKIRFYALDVTADLIFFLPFSFFLLCACPQIDVWVYICIFGSTAAQICTYTNVYIYSGKGKIWVLDWQFWLWASDSWRKSPSATFQCSINNQAPDLGAAAGVMQKGRICKCKFAVIFL